MFRQNFPEARRRDVIVWLLIALVGSFVGLLVTFFSFREGIDFGDGSTFFQFAHNLAHGEVIYKDFIHFRTPGSYFLQTLFISVFGDQQSSVRFALGFESHVLYTFFFAVAAAIFLRFKHTLIGTSAVLVILLLPAYAQLRTALAFVAVALYIQAYRVKNKGRYVWLLASGCFVGFAFIFGQEAALMAILTLGIVEISRIKRAQIKTSLKNMGLLALGFIIGLLPLLLYVIILSDISTFLYYTLYYAFVLQPGGMDLIYPAFEYANLVYYLVFGLYVVIFVVFYTNKKVGLPEATLLIFGIFRMITLLGRSDIGHLIFILPELLLLAILAIARFKTAVFNAQNTKKAAIYGTLLLLSFYAAIRLGGILLIFSALIVIVAFTLRRVVIRNASTNITLSVFFVLSGLFAVLLYLTYPHYLNTIELLSGRGLTSTALGGVNVDQATFDKVAAISKEVAPLHPKTIFSYPIQPYYYSLAPKHAAHLLTFEPQTTDNEQRLTIQDLKANKPEVIIYDPVQADSMEKVLGKINSYIKDNYKVEKEVEMIWIMVPKNR